MLQTHDKHYLWQLHTLSLQLICIVASGPSALASARCCPPRPWLSPRPPWWWLLGQLSWWLWGQELSFCKKEGSSVTVSGFHSFRKPNDLKIFCSCWNLLYNTYFGDIVKIVIAWNKLVIKVKLHHFLEWKWECLIELDNVVGQIDVLKLNLFDTHWPVNVL